MFGYFKSSKGLRHKALKGTAAAVALTGGGHALRFLSNLILTRLLFPEAFGMMALIQVVLIGLQMVSTFGLRAAVMQNPRADEEVFLHTAWTLQIIRGVILWLVVCLIAPTAAWFYEQPLLAQMLPVAGLSLLISGFHSINVLRVQRHMQLGRHTVLTLAAQIVSLVFLSLLAWWLSSVWALVLGMLLQPTLALILYAKYLPGPKAKLAVDRSCVREILGLGKFLFISSMATYVLSQSDRAVLGMFIPIDILGVYGIAFALASLPPMVANAIAQSVIFPLYRMRHPLDEPHNQKNIFRARRYVSAMALLGISALAWISPWLIDLLYDPRYALAGAISVLLCTAHVPIIVLNGVMHAALSKGDSYRFMIQNTVNAMIQGGLLYLFVSTYGLVGAIMAIGLTQLISYPLLAYYAHKYNSWDKLGDTGLICAGFVLTGGACWLHWQEIMKLF